MRTRSLETAAKSLHHRLGHANMRVIDVMMNGRRYGMLPSDAAKTPDCLSCTQAKLTRSRCNGTLLIKNETITIQADICGTMKTTFCGGNKYFLAMTTGDQKYVGVRFLKTRSKIKGYFGHFINWI